MLVDELYGELPSRIFSILLKKGRSTIHQLREYTEMAPRQIRHGLAVLHQHNLLYYHIEKPGGPATYEANIDYAYNLVRTGKILEMVDNTFGAPAKDVMQNLVLSGQTRVADLVAAYQEKIDRTSKAKSLAEEMDMVLDEVNGAGDDSQATKKSDLIIKSAAHLNSVICRLVEAELIDVCHAKTFETYDDIYEAVEKEVTATHFPGGVRGGKQKADYQNKLAEALRKVRGESKSLKRKLEQNGMAAKRRKIFQEIDLNGAKQEEDMDPALDPKQVIRINYEKCTVELRNRRLVQFASDMLGDVTSYVYAILLKKITRDISRCRLDPLADHRDEDDGPAEPTSITTDEILDSLKTSLDLSLGLGKADKAQLSARATAKTVEHAPKKKLLIEGATVIGDASSDEEEDDSDEEEYDGDYKPATSNGVSGVNGTKVKFEEPPKERKMDRRTQLRQHLLLLSESTQSFVRHCGAEEWTIDFEPVMAALREAELDTVIERTCGKEGLRLVRILRAKGKLDEKALPNVALMRKSDIQQKMLEMQRAGFVHVQEVPREPKADVKKSFFLWFCDVGMSLERVLDTSYKTMLHCMQVLSTLREQEKDVLTTTKRSDVRGREQEMMRKEYYEKYSRFLKSERMLYFQVMKIDDLVAALRDY